MTTRYLICGGRDFDDEDMLNRALRSLILHPLDAVIIHGAARGADQMAARWGRKHGAQVQSFPAAWDTHGKAAGIIRNAHMLKDGQPDVVLAFPGGRGTADMVTRARKAKLVVIIITGKGGDWYGEGGDVTDPLAKLRDRRAQATIRQFSTTRSCEDCDVCCTAPGITDRNLVKEPATPCKHLGGEAGHSCTIYDQRPRTCRLFYCVWRAFDHVLPEWMAPKDCGFMLSFNNPSEFPSVVTVHPLPGARWDTLWHQTVFAELAIAWNCIVAVGQSPDQTVAVFAPDGTRILKSDCVPGYWDILCRADGKVGVPGHVFGPDRRPLIDRIWETQFTWGIRPPS